MRNIQQVVVGSTMANNIKLNLGESRTIPKTKPFRFTTKAEELLFKKQITVYVSKKDLGTTRIANEDDVVSLVEKAKHIQPDYLHSYLGNLSQFELAELELSFIFLEFDQDIKIAEQLDNMLFFLEHAQEGSLTGKIDYVVLEKQFSKLIKDKPIANYIPQARKRSFSKVLSAKGGK